MEAVGIGTLLLGFISFLFIYTLWNSRRKNHKLPPGPTPLPLIGNLLQIERGQLVNSLMKFSKQYGSVYTLYFGTKPVICLSGYETVKEALIDKAEEFGGRGRQPTMEKVTKDYGIALSNGERWKQIRTFTLRNLRELGFGKKSFEEKIQEEAKYVVEELKKLKGKPLEVTKLIMDAVSNVLFSIIFGSRYEYKDETFVELLGIVEETYRLMSCPWGQEKDNPNSEFNEKNLEATIHNLFLTGTDTVTSTLSHTFLLILYHPEVQEKLQMEIDGVIGRDRIPNINDKADMPYTEAVMQEVHRFCDLLPFSGPHQVTKDVEFRGYFFPKGTEVYPLLCTVHRDPTKFTTPYKFNPNLFLDENGKFKKNDAVMAFSAGKRSCPGEGLARMEFFLFLTTILQNFKLTSETRFTEADIAPKFAGFLNSPINYKLSFIPR